MAVRNFPFAFAPRYRWAAAPFGITPHRAGIEVDDTHLRVRFGPWEAISPLANITDVTITGPYWFAKTAGPARLGITDRGLTFATNSRAGVCLCFARPIVGIDRVGVIRHPNLTLTPSDVSGLAALLEDRRGSDG